MDTQFILYEKKGKVATITLNRPEVLNALHPPAVAELGRIWADFRDDSDLWAAIITGAGERAFCTGDDLKYRSAHPSDDVEKPAPVYTPVNCYKPVIAAVNGVAAGGGFEIVLGCDIIIAAAGARFGLPEPRRGLLADAGGTLLLPRRIPYHQAMGMILTGRLFSAEEMLRMNLLSEIIPQEDLLPAAHRWAQEILECSPIAVQAAKQVVVDSAHFRLDAAQEKIEELHWVSRLRSSQDYREGPKAFSEKRKPDWQGL